MWTMRLGRCSRYLLLAFGVTLATGFGARDACAKPYACGTQTCSPHKTKPNCEVCTSAVCDKNGQGQEVLVPGKATTTKCTEPAKIETPPTAPPSKNPAKGAATTAPGERLAR